ncbi:MAG: interleukin-like EMT inducer domain-containing protein [Planctomycetota bacterium]
MAGSTKPNGADGYDIAGAGRDIWDSSDSFRFMFQKVSGDCEISARVTSLEHTDPWAKAGVMVRQSTASGSIHAMIIVSAANGVAFQRRIEADKHPLDVPCFSGQAGTLWLRLTRSGKVVTAYMTTDEAGQAWQRIGTEALEFSDPVLVGLCVCSHKSDALNTAGFRSVKLRAAILPPFSPVAPAGDVAPATPPVQQEKRVSVPTPEQLKTAEATIRETFKDEFKKSDAALQKALAAKLLELGVSTKNDDVARYQLLQMAIDLAVKQGEVSVARQAAELVVAGYEVDATKYSLKVLDDAGRNVREKGQYRQLAEAYLSLADAAFQGEDYGTAITACGTAQRHARSAQDTPLETVAAKRGEQAGTAKAEFERVKIAREKLFENPVDGESSLIVGRYYCLRRGDFGKAMPLLAKASDQKWADAAKTDLADPQTVADQVLVADKWYDLALGLPKSDQEQVKFRAKTWYEKALFPSSGVTRIKIEKRLQELQNITTGGQGIVSALPQGIKVISVGKAADPESCVLIKIQDQAIIDGHSRQGDNSRYRGVSVVALQDGHVVLKETFDTHETPGPANQFADAIEKLPKGAFVILAACDEPVQSFSNRAQEAIFSIGGKIGLLGGPYRASYICIGAKGLAKGTAYFEEIGTRRLEYPPVTDTRGEAGKAIGTAFPGQISEATRRALPTDEELKKFEELGKDVKNGDRSKRSEMSKLRSSITDELCRNIEQCLPADFKARLDAEAKTNRAYYRALYGDASFGSGSANHVANAFPGVAAASKTPDQFLAWLKQGKECKLEDQFRKALHQYVTNNPTLFPTVETKIRFCDWLRQGGLNAPGIEEYKKDLK